MWSVCIFISYSKRKQSRYDNLCEIMYMYMYMYMYDSLLYSPSSDFDTKLHTQRRQHFIQNTLRCDCSLSVRVCTYKHTYTLIYIYSIYILTIYTIHSHSCTPIPNYIVCIYISLTKAASARALSHWLIL